MPFGGYFLADAGLRPDVLRFEGGVKPPMGRPESDSRVEYLPNGRLRRWGFQSIP
jgi:hypothetical protein